MFSTVLCIIAIKWTTHVSLGRPLYRRTYRLSLCCSVTLRITWTSICWRYASLLRSNKVHKFEGDQRGWLMVSRPNSERSGFEPSWVDLVTVCCDKTLISHNGKCLTLPRSTGVNGYELVSFDITSLKEADVDFGKKFSPKKLESASWRFFSFATICCDHFHSFLPLSSSLPNWFLTRILFSSV